MTTGWSNFEITHKRTTSSVLTYNCLSSTLSSPRSALLIKRSSKHYPTLSPHFEAARTSCQLARKFCPYPRQRSFLPAGKPLLCARAQARKVHERRARVRTNPSLEWRRRRCGFVRCSQTLLTSSTTATGAKRDPAAADEHHPHGRQERAPDA